MNSSLPEIEAAAIRLRVAEETGKACAPVREMFANPDLATAYAIQAVNREHWLKNGRRIVGRKVALSARAAQKAMGLSEPAWGTLYADMLLGDGDEIPAGRIMQPRLEGEVAIVLERDLTMEKPTLVDVLRAVGYAVPAIEVVGCRIANLDTKPFDLLADNAGGGAFVLGSPARKLDGLDLRRLGMSMSVNGTQVAAGKGDMVYGNPLHALAWLAGRLSMEEMPLEAGDVIMTGTFFAMLPAKPGDHVEIVAEGLGRCEVSFGA